MLSTNESQLDQLISLAFSMHSSPGSYTFVLGAGISVPSGVPSAWGVQTELLAKLATVYGEQPDDTVAWYADKFGNEPTYESLLEHLAPTQHTRQSLLKHFFEPTEEEREQRLKEPTLAHRSIARLVAEGVVRVILTLNFDRLMETALKDEGIEPVVISQPSDIEGMAPLHTLSSVVIHLHGDYLNPTAMLNTKSELAAYCPTTKDFLSRITYDHGLVFVGWSATYDPALRSAIAASSRRVYQPYWVEPGQFSEVADSLRSSIGAVHVAADADTALGRLSDAVASLADRQSRHPLTLATTVASAKRYLAGRPTAIGLHDQIKQEVDTLQSQKDLATCMSGEESPNGGYRAMVDRVEEATTILAGLAATSAYWGDDSTDRWWMDEIPRLATRSRGSGLVNVLELPKVSGVQLLYASGVAAVAARRFDLVHRLLTTVAEDPDRGPAKFCLGFEPVRSYGGADKAGKRLFEHLAPLFVDHLNVGAGAYDEAWDAFEFLRLVEATFSLSGSNLQITKIEAIRQARLEAKGAVDEAMGTNDVDRLENAEASFRQSSQQFDRALGQYASIVPAWSPYLFAQAARNRYGHSSLFGQKILAELERQGHLHVLMKAGFCGGDWASLVATCEAVDIAVGSLGHTAAIRSLPGGSGVVPDYFRIGDL
ncbi:SIR2 family protein [Arthrobacter sp. UYCu723]